MNQDQLTQALEAATQTARLAGALLKDRFDAPRTISEKTTITDLVTEVDLESEALCKKNLQERFPADFLGEEGGGVSPKDDAPLWVVDPLDGTVNYAHKFPVFCVSIALCLGRHPIVGAVYDPMRDELFSATKGQGAFLNGKPLSVSHEASLSRALVATGFPYDVSTTESNLSLHNLLIKRCVGIRRAGSAALDLCYVAAGRLDGYWEKHLKPWDIAAGQLFVTEAKGAISDYQGKPTHAFIDEIVATNGHIHQEMLSVIQEHKAPAAP